MKQEQGISTFKEDIARAVKIIKKLGKQKPTKIIMGTTVYRQMRYYEHFWKILTSRRYKNDVERIKKKVESVL